jgi:cytochrome c-type biogenesis protein CcmH
VASGEELPELLAQLAARMEEQPDDVEGWLLLGRSYKSIEQYGAARDALRRGRAAAPDDPRVAVELAEALIFTSTDAGFSDEVRSLLDEAVSRDPQQQKVLWLLGPVAFQEGQYEAALTWWQRLSVLLEPGSSVAQTVAVQMDEARRRLGIATLNWPGLELTIKVADGLPALTPMATLFIIARTPGGGGPPLGAMRIDAPSFPVAVHLDDGNSMLPQRPVSGEAQIEVLARLSFSGQPTASAEDWQSVPLVVSTTEPASQTLTLGLEPPAR